MCAVAVAAIAGAKVLQGYMQGAGQKTAYDSQADSLDFNAQLSDRAAGDALDRGSNEQVKSRIATGNTIASQKTAYAASGVDVQSGSALDMLSSTALLGELRTQTIRNNAAREAFGYSTKAKEDRRSARYMRSAGSAAVVNGILGGAIGGASFAAPMMSLGGGPSNALGGANNTGSYSSDDYRAAGGVD